MLEMLEPRVHFANVGLDPSFGTGGLTTFGVANQLDVALSITLQSDNKIVVGGYNQNGPRQALLTRLLSNGAFDASFGTGGSSQITGMSDPWSLAIGAGGNIISAGAAPNGKANGGISSTSAAGVHQWTQSINLGASETFYDVKFDSGGSIIAVGAGNGINGTAFLFAKVGANGALDANYSGGGAFLDDLVPATNSVDGEENGNRIVPDANGGYLAVGAAIATGAFQVVSTRHYGDGERDGSYGDNGVAGPSGPANVGPIGDVKVLPNGSFFVATASYLEKFTANGSLDLSFPVQDLPGGGSQEIRLLPDGNIAVVTFGDPVRVLLFDPVGNLLAQSQSAALSPGHSVVVNDGIIQDDGKVLVTGRWSPNSPGFPDPDWSLTNQEYVARTQAFSVLAVPEPASVFVGAMVAVNLLARRLKRHAHHQRGRNDLRRSRSSARGMVD